MIGFLVLALLGGPASPEQIAELKVSKSSTALTFRCKPRSGSASDSNVWIAACNELATVALQKAVSDGVIEPIDGDVFKQAPDLESALLPPGAIGLKMVGRDIKLRK